MLAQRREGTTSGKASKDLGQASALITVLAEDRPRELAAAWREAHGIGPKWRAGLARSLAELPTSARDGLLKAITAP
jgi:hypothetical protein